jgi:membrane fusion protein, multidrug efflux system
MSDEKQNRWGRRLAPAIVISLAVLAVVGVAMMPGRKKEAAKPVVQPVNVQTLTIQPIAELPDTIEMPGVVEVNAVVKVAAEVDGRIEKLSACEGQTVKKGQEIARLNTELLQADFDRAVADDELKAKDLERVETLFAKKIANEQERDQSRTNRAVSQAVRRTAKARLDRAVIFSPLTGILDKLPAKEGEYVTPGACIGQVVDKEIVKVVVQIAEHDMHKIALNDAVKVRLGDREFAGKISYIGQVADAMTRTTRVEVEVDNRDHALHSGQIVRAFVNRGAMKDVVMVPLSAVIPLEDGKEVFCMSDGKACRKRVALGVIKGDRVQILPEKDMLRMGDQLIVVGQRYVSDGQAVVVQPGK